MNTAIAAGGEDLIQLVTRNTDCDGNDGQVGSPLFDIGYR